MKRITKKQFLADVMHEIDSLKTNATKEELENLNLKWFNYNSQEQCIYGQMTGSCESKRAKELMDKSCVRVSKKTKDGVDDFRDQTFTSVSGKINGEYSQQPWRKYEFGSVRTYDYLSALEAYIALKDANIEGIISYMKGETSTLKL